MRQRLSEERLIGSGVKVFFIRSVDTVRKRESFSLET